MKRFKNILLLLRDNTNDRGIERATDLASANGARLTLIREIGRLTKSLELFKGLASFGQLRADSLAKQHDELDELRKTLTAKGLVVEIDTPTASSSADIIRQVIRNEHDLVITTAQGDPGSAGRLFKSLSLQLIRQCPCPVWVIHPVLPRRSRSVMVAVDPTASGQGVEVNLLIMQLATSLAHLDEAKLHIVHAYYALEVNGMEHILYSPLGTERDKNYRACVDAAVDERRRNLDSLLKEHPLDEIDHEVHFLQGAAYNSIPRIAKELQVDVIVLGSITHTKVAGHFIGATAEDIIQRVGCSVLTVKPLGFHSPVEP